MSALVFHCTNCDMWVTMEWSDGYTAETLPTLYGLPPSPERMPSFNLLRVLPAFTDETGVTWCEVQEGAHTELRCKELVDQYNDRITKQYRTSSGATLAYRSLMRALGNGH